MTDTTLHPLPHGITLHCRTRGDAGRPVLVFLHGFPEGAFIWDGMLEHFARPENGAYRCVAPFLRGFAPSSSPQAVEAYRAKHLVQDLAALIEAECGPAAAGGRLAALVAHDWGGAVAWNLANQRPDLLERLVIVNSPHPGTFLRELQHSPEQQEASEYMHFLCRPDAEALLAEDGYRRLFGFFDRPDGSAPGWLTPELRGRYRATWDEGLTGPCNYYRASPLRPPSSCRMACSASPCPRWCCGAWKTRRCARACSTGWSAGCQRCGCARYRARRTGSCTSSRSAWRARSGIS